MGNTSMAAPSASPGADAAAIAKVNIAIKQLQEAFGMVAPGSPLGKELMKSIERLGKVAPDAKSAPGVGMEAAQQQVQQMRQLAPMMAMLRAHAAGGGAGGPGPTTPPDGSAGAPA